MGINMGKFHTTEEMNTLLYKLKKEIGKYNAGDKRVSFNEIKDMCRRINFINESAKIKICCDMDFYTFINYYFSVVETTFDGLSEIEIFDMVVSSLSYDRYDIIVSNNKYILRKEKVPLTISQIIQANSTFEKAFDEYIGLLELVADRYAYDTSEAVEQWKPKTRRAESAYAIITNLDKTQNNPFNTISNNKIEKQLRIVGELFHITWGKSLKKRHASFFYTLITNVQKSFDRKILECYEIFDILAIVFRYAYNNIPIPTNGNIIPFNAIARGDLVKQWQYYKNICEKIERIIGNIEKFDSSKHILYIYKGNILCKRHKHNMLQVVAVLEDANGAEINLNVEYCQNCQQFLLEYTLYEEYRKKYGTIIGNLRFTTNGEFFGEYTLETESPLHLSGYNVARENGLKQKERQFLLAKILYKGIMTKGEVIRYLGYFIKVNGAKKGNEQALKKWQEDLDFVQKYNIEEQPRVYIEKVMKR